MKTFIEYAKAAKKEFRRRKDLRRLVIRGSIIQGYYYY